MRLRFLQSFDNIQIFYLLAFLQGLLFSQGIWQLYYLRFTDYSGIGLLEAVLLFTALITEIPTGALGDVIGRRRMMIVSTLLVFASSIFLTFAPSIFYLLVSMVFYGLGLTFASGSREAFIYDFLKMRHAEEKYDAVLAKANTLSLIAVAVGTLLGGFFYHLWFRLPFLAEASVAFLTVFIALAFITIVGVVFITEGQRKIPIVHARQMRGRSAGGAKSFLPLRVNQAGVIPIIFAISLLLFPTFLAQFFVSSSYPWLANVATNVLTFFNQNLWYATLYFILVFVFTYFYTSVIFHPDQIAENLQRQGAFIPGIRPGEPTAVYLKNVSQRILLAGAAFLGLIAILPIMVQSAFQLNALSLGGTSLLIVVSVVLESIKQIEAQIVTRDYESF